MAYPIAIRFTITAGNIDFDQNEIEDIIFQPARDFQVQEHQEGAPYIYMEGDVYQTVIVVFNDSYADTREKTAQIINEEKEIIFFYQYAFAPAVSVNVIWNPSETEKKYFYGNRAARTIETLTFEVT